MFKIKYKKQNAIDGKIALHSYKNNEISHHVIFEDGGEIHVDSRGFYHRTDGPSFVFPDGGEWYCFEGVLCTFEKWQELCSK